MKPTNIKLHKQSRVLEISFEDGSSYELPTEYLRVYSPSAEVRGHGPGQETLQVGKQDVNSMTTTTLVSTAGNTSMTWQVTTRATGKTMLPASMKPDTLTTTRI